MAHIEDLASLTDEELAEVFNSLSDEEAEQLIYDWTFWARANQLAPEGTWRTWLLLAGRGFGKTRTGAEYVKEMVESGEAKRIALIAPTPGDARDVMIEGESGLKAISPPWNYPYYEPSKRRITWPNGAMATVFSGSNPEQLRGPQHDLVWADELAAWKYPKDTWDNMKFGLRLGDHPHAIVTTTPKPIPLVQKLVKMDSTHVTKGSTFDNQANLADEFIDEVLSEYEGTKLGRQELYAEILDDTEGALWKRNQIEKLRVKKPPHLQRIVVAVDPAVTSEEDSDETGIIVAGIGTDRKGYLLDDLTTKGSPDEWAKVVVDAYHTWEADRIVAEVNQGGDLVESLIRTVDKKVPYKGVHATRGKYTRAEPISALYEQGRVNHVGSHPKLEDQMTTWVPSTGEKSPDRVDATVWAFTDLILNKKTKSKVKASTV